MKKNSIGKILILLLSFFALFLTGCEAEDNTEDFFATACRLYGEGNYRDAEEYFVKASLDGSDSMAVVGHAYNLLKLGKESEALSEFKFAMAVAGDNPDYFKNDPRAVSNIRRAMLDIYATRDDIKNMLPLVETLLEEETNEQTYTKLYEIKAVCDRELGNASEYAGDLRRLIELKYDAVDEFLALYELSDGVSTRKEQLALADEFVIYASAHSAYIDDFSSVIGLLFDAAELAGHTSWDKDSEYYFEKAEEYMNLAKERGASDKDVMKYKIVMQERLGKLDIAEKLLGVYLNHYPDDKMAFKEKQYLNNRLGVR